MGNIPRIVSVEPREQAELVVRFDNGVQKTYDCRPLFGLPQFALLRNSAFFRAVRVDPGGYGVSWNDNVDLSEYELWVRGVAVIEQKASLMETITYSQVQDLVQQLPPQCLPTAYRLLRELSEQSETLQAQVDFMQLPLSKRREVLARQAESLSAYYAETAEERGEWQAGDFLDAGSAR